MAVTIGNRALFRMTDSSNNCNSYAMSFLLIYIKLQIVHGYAEIQHDTQRSLWH